MSVEVQTADEYDHVNHIRVDFGDLNLLTQEAIDQLDNAIDSIPPTVSVVTIEAARSTESAVRGFSAGLHLDSVKDLSVKEARTLLQSLQSLATKLRDMDAVTVSGCGDYALAGGLLLPLVCDFRIATTDAVLGVPEINAGLITGPPGGLLIRLVGLQAAKEMVYTGEPISGARAQELGLVNDAVPENAYYDTIDEIVTILAEKSPLILQWQKQAFCTWRSNGIEAGIDHSIEMIAACFDTYDQQEAMEAFIEDRKPEFRGE